MVSHQPSHEIAAPTILNNMIYTRPQKTGVATRFRIYKKAYLYYLLASFKWFNAVSA
jgi:hypothetical protein